MMVRTILVAGVLAAIAGSPLAAQQANPSTFTSSQVVDEAKPVKSADNPRPSDVALRLARVMQPEDLMLAMSERMFRQVLRRMLAEDAEIDGLEKKHPGILAAIVNETSAEMMRFERAGMPSLHRRYAQLYESMFQPDEMAEMITLYASPVGRKLLEAKLAGLDAEPLVQSIADKPDAPIERKTIEDLNTKATQTAAATMTPADGAAIMKLVRPSTLLKMRLAQPTIIKFETEIANEEDPRLDAAIEEVVERVIKRFGA
jgi:hypothetical protein